MPHKQPTPPPPSRCTPCLPVAPPYPGESANAYRERTRFNPSVNPYESPAEVPSPDYSRSKYCCAANDCTAFQTITLLAIGFLVGMLASSFIRFLEAKYPLTISGQSTRQYRQTEIGVPLDGLRDRIDKRREEHKPKPVEPITPHDNLDAKPKPRPVVHWLGRMFKNTADLFALPTKIELHAVLIALLTLLTVVVGMTFGFLKARYYYKAQMARRKR